MAKPAKAVSAITQTANTSDMANAIRALSIDAVQQANSGHPGAPMGMADIMAALWCSWLKHNPADPNWLDRDRFVLSNGHGSMLLYAALHLSGYALPLDEIRAFRQYGSATPGHPEVDITPGVEATTGPLGQGFANAVGMALAEKILAAHYNRPDFPIIDHRTWVFLGDGCLMEGISHEAASLAGVLQLGKLIAVYDDNQISIDGSVSGWLKDDTAARFKAYGWHVIPKVDGHDSAAIHQAFSDAKKITVKPVFICMQTTIGFGSPAKQGTAAAHGAALGEDEVQATRKNIGWQNPAFDIPEPIYKAWDCKAKGAEKQAKWQQLWDRYEQQHPESATTLKRALAGDWPVQLEQQYASFIDQLLADPPTLASRAASRNCLQLLGTNLPELVSGSADLTESCCTSWPGCSPISATKADGNYLHYGVREFAMTAIANGLALHGGLRPCTGTFLTFSDYARNAVRMAAVMHIPQVLIYTHDSIGLGEDGPTHQPIEQLTHLRTTPNLSVWRPCDAVETAIAWRSALRRKDGPTALILSRQKLSPQVQNRETCEAAEKGGYILLAETTTLQIILIATGSEVNLAVQGAALLRQQNIGVRVVSMPSVDVFCAQPDTWQTHVLPTKMRCRLAIEAAHPDYWRKFVGLDGDVLGINHFGASAPATDLFSEFGFVASNVATRAKALLKAS